MLLLVARRRAPRPRRRPSTTRSTSGAARTATSERRAQLCSPPLVGRATSPRCRRTTSRSSPLADELRALGAFRADVSGAGPAVYGLFDDRAEADAAAEHARGAAAGSGSCGQRGRLRAVSETAAEPRPSRHRRSAGLLRGGSRSPSAIAVVEGILVALEKDFSRWTVIVIAAPIIAFYLFAGPDARLRHGPAGLVDRSPSRRRSRFCLVRSVAILIGSFALIIAGALRQPIALILLLGERSAAEPDLEQRR